MNIFEIQNPNLLGEVLRERFFDHSKGYGCYSTFDVNEDVEEMDYKVVWLDEEGDFLKTELLPKEKVSKYLRSVADEVWHRYKIRGLATMEYFWDGDGFLRFILPDGRVLSNNDCKKNYYWEWEL